jgi:hypothetical protein
MITPSSFSVALEVIYEIYNLELSGQVMNYVWQNELNQNGSLIFVKMGLNILSSK